MFRKQCTVRQYTTLIYLMKLLGKLVLGLWLDSELHYFSIFTENKKNEHLIFCNVTDVNLVLKERTHMRLCINMLIFTHNLGNWLIRYIFGRSTYSYSLLILFTVASYNIAHALIQQDKRLFQCGSQEAGLVKYDKYTCKK